VLTLKNLLLLLCVSVFIFVGKSLIKINTNID